MITSRRLNSPVVTMAVTLPATIAFVVLRWNDAAQRKLSRFVVAGSNYAQPDRVPKGLFVGSDNGYDGQFYYRLALDPFDLNRTAFGIRLDSYSRVERMGYPFLAWLVSLGQHSHVFLTLVIVNVVAAAVLGLAGGLLAQSAGRHALWGLVFPLYWGYLWTLGRDLTERRSSSSACWPWPPCGFGSDNPRRSSCRSAPTPGDPSALSNSGATTWLGSSPWSASCSGSSSCWRPPVTSRSTRAAARTSARLSSASSAASGTTCTCCPTPRPCSGSASWEC
jgi:hypothetical protein